MNIWLKTDRWKIFTITFFLPLLLFISGIIVPMHFLNGAWLFLSIPIAILWWQLTLYAWMYAIGTKLHAKAGLYKKFTNTIFRYLVLIPVISLVIGFCFWIWGAIILGMGSFSMSNTLVSSLTYIIPVQIIFFTSKLYCIYFVSRVIASAQRGEVVNFKAFSNTFILIILFPIGIWSVQPAINHLEKTLTNNSPSK